MNSTTSARTMEALRSLFARCGLPQELVSDNAPQFTSVEFQTFLRKNGVKQILVPPYHPASNGAAERSVQSLKQMLLKNILDTEKPNINLQHKLADWLFRYRNTPHTTTNRSRAQLFLNSHLRIPFSLFKPDLKSEVENKQRTQKHYHDSGRVKQREFHIGQKVFIRNHRQGKEKWLTRSSCGHQRSSNLPSPECTAAQGTSTQTTLSKGIPVTLRLKLYQQMKIQTSRSFQGSLQLQQRLTYLLCTCRLLPQCPI